MHMQPLGAANWKLFGTTQISYFIASGSRKIVSVSSRKASISTGPPLSRVWMIGGASAVVFMNSDRPLVSFTGIRVPCTDSNTTASAIRVPSGAVCVIVSPANASRAVRNCSEARSRRWRATTWSRKDPSETSPRRSRFANTLLPVRILMASAPNRKASSSVSTSSFLRGSSAVSLENRDLTVRSESTVVTVSKTDSLSSVA
mmetsp:Transcript_85186/g.227723  ORF Transcript_85186/g.227723 Transcript_85186/m.227723 type:complete len:202 (+) Transcript_85186:764-1369(+)